MPKRRWLDRVRDDIKKKGLSREEVNDRATWRHISSNIDPTSVAYPGGFSGCPETPPHPAMIFFNLP